MARLSQADLIDLNQTFEERTPQELITWAVSMFGERLAALSSMQKSGNVVCHMLHSLGLKVPVMFVDTGVLFEESLQTRDRISREYGLEVVTLTPEQTMQEQIEELGVLYLTVEGQQQCCDLRKTQPLVKAADRFDALLGSLRRSDGGRRAQCPILDIDPSLNCLRVNPLVNVSSEQLAEYIREHNVIVNPLHAQGFATIGCNRCTTPVLEHEEKRAGRWRHLGSWAAYCGINPSDLDPKTSKSIELPQELVDKILGRTTDFMI